MGMAGTGGDNQAGVCQLGAPGKFLHQGCLAGASLTSDKDDLAAAL